MSDFNGLLNEIVDALTIEEGALNVPDRVLLEIGKRIHAVPEDKREEMAAVLIAIAARLKEMPSSRRATSQVAFLAAVALGDAKLNGVLCRAIYSGGASGSRMPVMSR